MLAQVYQVYNDDDFSMRIFDRDGLMLATIPLKTLNEADKALKRLRIRRRERWLKTDWGLRKRR